MKKEILIPFMLLFLGLIFTMINIIIYFSKRNSWFISKKLKVGAMIITFIGILSCGSTSQPDIKTSTCYAPIPQDINKDSIELVKKKYIDSITKVKGEKQKKDSIQKSNKKKKIRKKEPPQPTCYMMRLDN
jgi:hypothetical protein